MPHRSHNPAEIAARAAALGGSTALARVVTRREQAVHCGPDGALRPPRLREQITIQLLIRDGAGRRGLAEIQGTGSVDELSALAEQARAIAAGSPVDLRPFPAPAAGGDHEGFDQATADVEIGWLVAAARAAASATEFALGRGRSAIARAEVVRSAIASSDGAVAEDARTAITIDAHCSDDDGQLLGHGHQASRAADLLDPVGVGLAATPPQYATGSAALQLLAADAHQVVLRPTALAPLLCAFADAACTGHAHATGTSPYTGRLGAPAISEQLTLLDSPRYLHTLGRSLDPEGTAAQPVTLFDAGIAIGVLHDTTTAQEWGTISTGHAAGLAGSPAGAIARNLFLLPQPGGGTAEDLAARAQRPVVVVPLIEQVVRESPVSTRVRALGRGAYLASGGAPGAFLGDVVLVGDLAAALQQCSAVGGEGSLVARLSVQPDQVRATHCPAVQLGAINVVSGGAGA